MRVRTADHLGTEAIFTLAGLKTQRPSPGHSVAQAEPRRSMEENKQTQEPNPGRREMPVNANVLKPVIGGNAKTSLPGLRAQFPSLATTALRFPAFSCALVKENSKNAGTTPHSAPLAPLRFIIPSSHCSSSSNACATGNSCDNMSGAETTNVCGAIAKADASPPRFSSLPPVKYDHHARLQVNGSTVNDVKLNESILGLQKKPSSAQRRSRPTKSSNRSTKSKARPGLRKGKWSEEESRYASRLTELFKEGLLPIERGTMLRLYLSQKLNCEPMRITKKFTGGECIGKQVYRPCSPTPESRVKMMQAQLELVALEAAFHKRLRENNEELPDCGTADKTSPRSGAERNRDQTRCELSLSDNDGAFETDGSTSDASESSEAVRSSPEPKKEAQATQAPVHNVKHPEDIRAVGLLLDFFHKVNQTECLSLGKCDPDLFQSNKRRERSLSISNCNNDLLTEAKRPRLDSVTLLTA